jgi:tetratricopeptide (TPR) repeat protein
MFDDQPLNRPLANSRTRRVLSILGVLVVVNVAAYLLGGRDNCTSWLASYFDRGTALDLYGDKAGAAAAYSEDLKRNPDHVEALQNRGKAYAALRQYDLAIDDFGKSIQLQPKSWAAFGDRARVYLELGKFDAAIEDFTRAVQLFPDWLTWEARGDAYLAQGDYDAAVADYTSSIKLDPVPPGSALFPRGVAYLRAGRFDLARDDFTTYAAACPDCTDRAEARDCAEQGSNIGKCAIPYPKPSNPMLDQILDAAGRSISGCRG